MQTKTKSFSLYEGVKHPVLGYANVINQEPDAAGNIRIKLEEPYNDEYTFPAHPSDLEEEPTDTNYRIIKIGDKVLYPIGDEIHQGVVVTIKWGKDPRFSKRSILRIGIRGDKSGYIKSVWRIRSCVVIEHDVIKKKEF